MKLPYVVAAVVFDMDGLLFDTETLHQEAITAAAEESGYQMTPAFSRRMIGCAWSVNRALLLSRYGNTFEVEEFRTSWQRHFDQRVVGRVPLKPGATELLDTLDELQLPRAIATSSIRLVVQRHLMAHGLADRFHEIVADGDYKVSKPAPDPFLNAAERLGVEPRLCLALEDSYSGIQSASAAGMMTVMVPDLLEPTDEIRELCIAVVHNLHEVRKLILES